jgi:hypothetical protein
MGSQKGWTGRKKALAQLPEDSVFSRYKCWLALSPCVVPFIPIKLNMKINIHQALENGLKEQHQT